MQPYKRRLHYEFDRIRMTGDQKGTWQDEVAYKIDWETSVASTN
jgi:hypothetical protein